MAKSYNLVGLYNLLADTFTTQEMSQLAAELFPDLYRKFTARMTKLQKVEVIVDYAERQERYLELLQHLEKSGNYKYKSQTQEEIDRLKIPTTPIPFHTNSPYGLQESFIGRREETQALETWLNIKENAPLFVLLGESGVGKSALAWHWQMQVRGNYTAYIEGVIWWDFYQLDANVLEFLHSSLAFLGDDPFVYTDPREQLERLLAHLQRKPIIIFLDGIERWLRIYQKMDSLYLSDNSDIDLTEEADCVHPLASELLRELARLQGKTKTLVTGRVLPREFSNRDKIMLPTVRQQTLDNLDVEDVYRLFSSLDIKTVSREVQAIGEPIGYHPLTLRLIAGYVAASNTPDDLPDAIKYDSQASIYAHREHILSLAYHNVPPTAQMLLSSLASFRGKVEREAVRAIYNPIMKLASSNGTVSSEAKKKKSWTDQLFRRKKDDEGEDPSGENPLRSNLALLQRRGLLHWTRQDDGNGRIVTTYDMHPIVRRYAYTRLTTPAAVHTILGRYFQSIPQPYNARRPSDLSPTIELYYQLVMAQQYDQAFDLFQERLQSLMESQIGVYQHMMIELLQLLLPPNDDAAPRLSEVKAQAEVLETLAELYSWAGQPDKAIELYKLTIRLLEQQEDVTNTAVALSALVDNLLQIGALKEAETHSQRCLELYEKVSVRYKRIPGHWNNGRLLAFQGNWARAKVEFGTAMGLALAENATESQSVTWAFRAQMALLKGDIDEAYSGIQKSYKLAKVRANPKERIRVEWLMGWANIEKGQYAAANEHLKEALNRSRSVGIIEFEPAILLAQAKLIRVLDHDKDISYQLTDDAIRIAQRANYRLELANIYSFLTRLALDVGNYDEAQKLAKNAHHYAMCDGPPHTYQLILQETDRLLRMMSYTL